MKSKEAIRKELLHYINLTWETTPTTHLNPLVDLMIETTCRELYLLENKLENIDSTVLERLTKKLAPTGYSYIRPAYSILYVKPDAPRYELDCKTLFTVKKVPDYLRNKGITTIGFTPACPVTLMNIKLTHIFHGQTLWAVNTQGNRSTLLHTHQAAAQHKVWIKLEAAEEVQQLKDLFFYLDFPHLDDNHYYFDLLAKISWSVSDHPLTMEQGMPVDESTIQNQTEAEALAFYKDHYQSHKGELDLHAMNKELLPQELSGLGVPEQVDGLSPGYWFSITFPPQFLKEDLSQLIVAVNAFPALNRQYHEVRIPLAVYGEVISLPSDIGEEFLDMDAVYDSSQTALRKQEFPDDTNNTYAFEPIRKRAVNDPKLVDYLERLIDISQDEKRAFPEIDSEAITSVLNAIAEVKNKETNKLDLNRLNEYAEVGHLSIYPQNAATSLDIFYWTSPVENANDIPAGTSLMAIKVGELNKSEAILLTAAKGGRSFYDIESLKAINRYFLTSKDRISTKHNILSFCRMEIGKYIRDIDVVHKAQISPKNRQGIINVMEIQITPHEKYKEYIKSKGVIKDLRIRLKQRSPDQYNYTFKIIEPTN